MYPEISTARQDRIATIIKERLHIEAISAIAVPIDAVQTLPVA